MAMVAATYIEEDRVEKVAIVVKVRPLQYLLARGSNLDLKVKKFGTDFQNFLAKISVITLYQYYTSIPFYYVKCKNQSMAGFNAKGYVAPENLDQMRAISSMSSFKPLFLNSTFHILGKKAKYLR